MNFISVDFPSPGFPVIWKTPFPLCNYSRNDILSLGHTLGTSESRKHYSNVCFTAFRIVSDLASISWNSKALRILSRFMASKFDFET